jgi:hypothetical protein
VAATAWDWLRQFELFQIDYNFTKIKIFVVGGFSSVVTLVLSEIYYGDQGPDVMRCMYFKFLPQIKIWESSFLVPQFTPTVNL